VLPVLGNHDTWPVNNEDLSKAEANKPVLLYDEMWADYFTTPEAKQTFKEFGYYSMPLKAGGKNYDSTWVIGINCQVANDMNWWRLAEINDPLNHIAWLEAELARLQKIGAQALIVSHFTPTSYLYSFGKRFKSLMERYQDVVRFSFTGHSHLQGFHITKSIKEQQPLGWSFLAGSVGSNGNKNPVFNVVEMDAEFMVPVGIEVYYADIMKANKEGKLTWEHYISWGKEYNLPDMRPSHMSAFAERIRDDEQTAINFIYNAFRGARSRLDECDEDCRLGVFCEVQSSGPRDGQICHGKTPKPSFYELVMDPWYEVTQSPW